MPSRSNEQSLYSNAGGIIARRCEKGISKFYARQNCEWMSLPEETREWLACHWILNAYVAAAVNGESGARSIFDIGSFVYRYMVPASQLWVAPKALKDIDSLVSGRTPLGRLALSLESTVVTLPRLLKSLQLADAYLSERPTALPVIEKTARIREFSLPATLAGVFVKALISDCVNASIYVHGSYADNTITDFSDVDDIVVVHRTAWGSYDSFRQLCVMLERIAKRFQSNDFLQHHGHIVLLDFDLALLDEGLIPFRVLQESACLCGMRELNINVWSDVSSIARNVWSLVQEVRANTVLLENDTLRTFGLKQLISGISLLPALVFQTRGVKLNKAEGIAKARDLYSPLAVEAIDWATFVRRRWRESVSGNNVTG